MILVLGTAMWGWTVSHHQAFDIADAFYDSGGRWFDTASNYPIDSNSEHDGLAARWLSEWINVRGHTSTYIIFKCGALHNNGANNNDLSFNKLEYFLNQAQKMFGTNLGVFSIHWDNRNDLSQIRETVDFLTMASEAGIQIGLSGIKYPSLYEQELGKKSERLWIQVKHNIFTNDGYSHYSMFRGKANFLAYGLNSGGLKLDGNYQSSSSFSVRGIKTNIDISLYESVIQQYKNHPAAPKNINDMGLAFVSSSPDFVGAIVGPSNLDQLRQSILFNESLKKLEDNMRSSSANPNSR